MFMGIDPGRDKCANVTFDPAGAANVPFDPAGAGVEYFMGIDPGRDKCGGRDKISARHSDGRTRLRDKKSFRAV